MATRIVDFILNSICGRIAHITERTEEILTTRTLAEVSKAEAKEEDSKEDDSRADASKGEDSKEEDSTQIRVAVLQEEAAEIMSSTSKDM